MVTAITDANFAEKQKMDLSSLTFGQHGVVLAACKHRF
ncbi:hypothetical protein SCODD09_01569 [Streptococcus constellatus]|nr:hypothetical protein SCODD09_01569 [Streptococcus constellatus]